MPSKIVNQLNRSIIAVFLAADTPTNPFIAVNLESSQGYLTVIDGMEFSYHLGSIADRDNFVSGHAVIHLNRTVTDPTASFSRQGPGLVDDLLFDFSVGRGEFSAYLDFAQPITIPAGTSATAILVAPLILVAQAQSIIASLNLRGRIIRVPTASNEGFPYDLR